jgi:hypothetical protein
MAQVETPATVTVEDDTLTVTVERQVASFGDHTTVRAHVGSKITPAQPDETLADYQARVAKCVAVLATPLKTAVLTELGLDFEVVDGVVLETVQTQRSEPAVQQSEPATTYNPHYTSGRSRINPQPPSQNGVKVVQGTKATGYTEISDYTSLAPSFDIRVLDDARKAGADTVFTDVGQRGRWYRIKNVEGFWTPPRLSAVPSQQSAEEPF